jgi:hypothetical protein
VPGSPQQQHWARRHSSAAAAAAAGDAPATLVIGAAGAVGKRLCTALAARGTRVIASDRMNQLPDSLQRTVGTCVGGIDVCDAEALKNLFREHADERTIVWNLAAPLSVEVRGRRNGPVCTHCIEDSLMVCQDRLWITVYGNSKHKRAFRADGDGSSRGRGGDCGRHGQRGGGDEGAETPSRCDLKIEVVNHLPRQARDKHEEIVETVETVACFAGRRRAAAVLHRLDRVVWRLGAAARRNSALAAREPHAGTTLDYYQRNILQERFSRF